MNPFYRRLVPGDAHLDAPRAWAVPLTQERGLPGAEGQLAVTHRGGARRSDEDGLDMGVGVALRMLERGFFGHQLAEMGFDVDRHVRIGALIDRHPRGRVGDEDVTYPILNARALDHLGHALGDVDELSPSRSPDLECQPAHVRESTSQ